MNDPSNGISANGRHGQAPPRGPPNGETAYRGNGRPVTTMLIPAGISVVPVTTHRVSRRIQQRSHPRHLQRLRLGTPIPLPLVRKSEADTQSVASGIMCRICFSGEEAGKLAKFCQCAGTIEFCHHHCLTRWIQQSNMQNCELCGYAYRMQQRPVCLWRWRCPPFQPLQQFFFCIYLVSWIALLGSAGWLLFVTFGFDPMYRDSELAPLIYGLYGLIAVAALGIIFFESIFVVRPFCNTLLRYNRETVVLPYNLHASRIESRILPQVENPRRRPANQRYNMQQNSAQTNFETMRRTQQMPVAEHGRTINQQCLPHEVRFAAVPPQHVLQASTGKMERNIASDNITWPVMMENSQVLQADENGSFMNYDRNATILNFARPVRNLHVAPIANQHVYCHVYAQNSPRNTVVPHTDCPFDAIQPTPSSSSSYLSRTASTSTNDTVSYTSTSRHAYSGNSLEVNEFNHHWVDRWMPVICASSEMGINSKANYITMPSVGDLESNVNIYFPYLQAMAVSSSEEQIHQSPTNKSSSTQKKEMMGQQTFRNNSKGKRTVHKYVQSPSVKTDTTITKNANKTSSTKVHTSNATSVTATRSAFSPKLHNRMYHSETSLALASTSSNRIDEK